MPVLPNGNWSDFINNQLSVPPWFSASAIPFLLYVRSPGFHPYDSFTLPLMPGINPYLRKKWLNKSNSVFCGCIASHSQVLLVLAVYVNWLHSCSRLLYLLAKSDLYLHLFLKICHSLSSFLFLLVPGTCWSMVLPRINLLDFLVAPACSHILLFGFDIQFW